MYLASLTKHLRVRSEKEKKAKPSKQEQQRNTNDPFTSSNALELNRELELIDRLNYVFGVEFIALVLNVMC
jgi:hypothetical protein